MLDFFPNIKTSDKEERLTNSLQSQDCGMAKLVSISKSFVWETLKPC